MKRIYFRLAAMLVMTGTALLLTGATGEVKSGPTSSTKNSMKSGITSSMTGSVPNSVKSSITTSVTGSIPGSMKSSVTSSVTGSITSTVTGSVAHPVASRTPAASIPLSPYAEELSRILKFDRKVLLMVQEETQQHVHRLIGYDENDYQIIAPGIFVPVPEDDVDRILDSLRHKLRPLKYMVFVVEMNEGLKIDKIGILKGKDQYEILRVMQTSGDNFDISTQDVIDRLTEWEKISSFEIIGADTDWVEIEFTVLPRDLKEFAEEVYDFCPDAVEQGPGNVEGLIKDIKKTSRLFLWWD